MSRHTKNPDCSVTVVKQAGYNGDDYFLLLMQKGAGGLADPLPYHFPQAIQSAMATYGKQSGPVAVFDCVVCQILIPLFKLFSALLLSPRSKTVVSGLSPLFHLFATFSI